MSKNIKNTILIASVIICCLFFYSRVNFTQDKQTLMFLKAKAGAGEVTHVLEELGNIESLSNPIINFEYQNWKKKMNTRFLSDENLSEASSSGSKVIDDVCAIYRTYWKTQLLKSNPSNRTDSTLYNQLTHYLLSNNLTVLSKDSLRKTIKNDHELTKIIDKEGFKSKFMLRNGLQDLLIWNKESRKSYVVTLPKDTVNTTVVFIEDYVLNGYDSYATFGSSQVGGWAKKESATLYCNEHAYNLNSEKFKISYLKHESLHFTDLNNYPNLSATDLEYRSKAIELMYCTEETIYDRVAQFLNGASAENRKHAHPFANYVLMKNLSQLLFQSDYEVGFDHWKKLTPQQINQAASKLYFENEAYLKNNSDAKTVI